MTWTKAEEAAKDAYAICLIGASNPKLADIRKLTKCARMLESFAMQIEAKSSGVIPPKVGVDDVGAMRAQLVGKKI